MNAKKLNLDKYRRDRNVKLDPFVTSLTLDKRHKEFLDRENLELSPLVRDFLDSLMAERYNEDPEGET